MHCSTNILKDILEIAYYIFAIIGSLSIIVFILSYSKSRKDLNHNILTGCNKRYQDILKQDPDWENPKSHILQQYLDLCSDELFYQDKKYIGDNIINDWLDGMISYLPHLIDGENYNKKCKWFELERNKDIYQNYNRVITTFSFTSESEYDVFANSFDSEKYKLLLKKLNDYSKNKS